MIAAPLRILIAGIGNIFRGDDAFGVELAQQLLQRPQRDGVKIVDFGIRGFDLAFALMDGPEVAIFLDATSRGGAPGTLYTVEIDPPADSPMVMEPLLEAHSIDPVRVLRMVQAMGGTMSRTVLIGCEPLTLGSEDEGALGLSSVVVSAVDRAVAVVESLVSTILRECEPDEEVVECQELR
jgi:hydrogenase maturation protease